MTSTVLRRLRDTSHSGSLSQAAFSGRRRLHLAPPFLLDDYLPRYQLLSFTDAAEKRSVAYKHLRDCNLCPRLCGVNRFEKTGTCLIGADVVVNTIAPHFGEEPCIQGHNGSGSVFFSGCNLRCGTPALSLSLFLPEVLFWYEEARKLTLVSSLLSES